MRKRKTLQSEYNQLTQSHFKTRNDLKTLETDFDQLTKDYGKMESISVHQEFTMLELESTCLQQREKLTKINIEMENCTHELQV